MHRKSAALFLIVFFSGVINLFAQYNPAPDSVSLTLENAENLFLQNNFLLLAAKYEVSAADAAIIQAKLYPNPNLSVDQGAYNSENKKWFDISKTGQTSASLQQVIILAGKRNKQVEVAKINSQIAAYQFYDLIRTLRYELRISFYGLYFLRQSIAVYDKEIESLKLLIDAYTTEYKKGNVAFKELARLQALQFGLQNERIDLLKDASEKQSNLILLTADTLQQTIRPVIADFNSSINALSIKREDLIDSGMINRYDLKAANAAVTLNQTNLALQKSLRVPDITVGANWDRQGSYIYNYNSLSLAIDLPFWNRNQGNIKIAGYKIEESRQQQLQEELQVKNEITSAYSRFVETDRLFKISSPQFTSDYEKLLDGITKGYQEHSISLLEFIDYYETYKNSKIEFIRLQDNRIDALENLNLATGISILK